MKLDKKDLRILYELDYNARQSCTRIAKKVKLSKDAVHYRIEKLEREGIIKHYFAVLNTTLLGYMHFNTLFRLRDVSKKQEFLSYCQNHKGVIWCVSCYGSWDYAISFLGKNLEEYQVFINELLNRFGETIHEKALSVMLDSPTFTREYLITGKEGRLFQYGSGRPTTIDETDHHILSLLSQNARLPVVEIAQQLALTTDIVRYRMKQLENKELIQGYRVGMDLEKLGHLYYKILFTLKDLTVEQERSFYEYCRTTPNILQFIKYLGNWEIQIELEVPTERDLFLILDEIREKYGLIIKTYDILRLTEEKLDFFPF